MTWHRARGFWNVHQDVFFDVMVFHPNAPSYRSRNLLAVYESHEDDNIWGEQIIIENQPLLILQNFKALGGDKTWPEPSWCLENCFSFLFVNVVRTKPCMAVTVYPAQPDHAWWQNNSLAATAIAWSLHSGWVTWKGTIYIIDLIQRMRGSLENRLKSVSSNFSMCAGERETSKIHAQEDRLFQPLVAEDVNNK